MRTALIFLLAQVIWVGACAVPGSAETSSGGQICPSRTIDVEPSARNSRLSFEETHFESSYVSSKAWTRVKNISTDPLDFVLVLIEFHRGEQYLLTMAFYESTADFSESYHLPIKLSPLFNHVQPLYATALPGSELILGSESPMLAVSCPDHARVTLLQTGFNGRLLASDFSETTWRFDPFVDKSPMDLKSMPENFPLSLRARVSVAANGRATVTSFNGWDLRVQNWLQRQIEGSWTFSPATYDATPVAAELGLIFRFFRGRRSRSAGTTLRDAGDSPVVVVVDVAPPGSPPSSQRVVLYGGVPTYIEPRQYITPH